MTDNSEQGITTPEIERQTTETTINIEQDERHEATSQRSLPLTTFKGSTRGPASASQPGGPRRPSTGAARRLAGRRSLELVGPKSSHCAEGADEPKNRSPSRTKATAIIETRYVSAPKIPKEFAPIGSLKGADEASKAQQQPPGEPLEVRHLEPGKRADGGPTGGQAAPEPPFMFAGMLGSILSSVFFSSSILCIKLLPDADSLQEKTKVLCFRGLTMMFLCGSSILISGSTFKVKRDELWVNILRSVFGYLGVMGCYVALSYISMGDSTALIFSSPIWTSILSHFILDEPIAWLQVLALPASLLGIVLIAHPALIVDVSQYQPAASYEEPLLGGGGAGANGSQTLYALDEHQLSFDYKHRWPGIAISLATSFLVSCVYIVLKFRKTTPIQTTTFWLGATTFFVSLAIMGGVGFGSLPRTCYEAFIIFLNGLSSWVGQSVLQWSFQYEDASILSIVRTLDVAMSFTLSAIFLDEDIYWTSVVGAGIIAAVVASIMFSNWLAKSSARRRSPPGSSPRHPDLLKGDDGEKPRDVSLAVGGGKRSAVYVQSA